MSRDKLASVMFRRAAELPIHAVHPRASRNRHNGKKGQLVVSHPMPEPSRKLHSAADQPCPVSYIRELSPVRRFGRTMAVSSAMLEVFSILEKLTRTDVTVAFIGETGTGKDVLAQAMHERSLRAKGPFVVFDCGAVAANLAESELYGHEKGSFTGAHNCHLGAFERAQGGTLFLDEIGELPLELQPRLLRVLENRSVRRVGGCHDRPVDVRVLAATNRNLRADVATGKFRQDLYFRMAGAEVFVPALRDRIQDLPLLVSSILEDLGASDLRLADATLEVLRAHHWPGNVRELKNTLACARYFAERGVVHPEHVRLAAPVEDEKSCLERLPLAGHALQNIERCAIQQSLAQLNGNKAGAARGLGIALSTLYEKIKKYEIHS